MSVGVRVTSVFEPVTLRRVAFRHTSPGRNPLSGSGAQRFGGRWNRPGGSATIYLADSLQTCVAEFRRTAEGQGRGAASLLPRELHRIALDGIELVDLAAPGTLEAAGLSADDIADSDWAKCQQLGEAVALAGHSGLRAPSATGLGHVIVLFEARIPRTRVRVVITEQLGSYL